MVTPFQAVSRVAIEEILKESLTPSRYGYFITQDDLQTLVSELSNLLITSRSLQNVGERLLDEQKMEKSRASQKHRSTSRLRS